MYICIYVYMYMYIYIYMYMYIYICMHTLINHIFTPICPSVGQALFCHPRKGSRRFNRQSFLQLGHTKKTEAAAATAVMVLSLSLSLLFTKSTKFTIIVLGHHFDFCYDFIIVVIIVVTVVILFFLVFFQYCYYVCHGDCDSCCYSCYHHDPPQLGILRRAETTSKFCNLSETPGGGEKDNLGELRYLKSGKSWENLGKCWEIEGKDT